MAETGVNKALGEKRTLRKGLYNNKNNFKSKVTNINETLNQMQFSIPHHYKPSLTLLG